ncbi:PKD domain-containing protein [Pontibacter sp. G13]|uniref:PKD domain-containing protein n=1 Tax=Pontibacter sp. G13 TaxID=3074898 RepID=UPI00288B8247|nr:PKD domain-containing protein [Pontibacter sp. G13]WNJ21326.1 PKD domain-containing protein [Pontibacter sp. G13]
MDTTRIALTFRWLLMVAALILGPNLWAQLPANQPEQDCFGALAVCQSVFTQANSYQGEGLNPNEINGGTSCLLSGERNDTWYIFTVQSGGQLAFSINPLTPTDDYDWAVYDLTNANCSDIFNDATLEVSCNFAGFPGVTGANGLPGAPNEPTIPVVAGQTLVLNVSNFSGSTSGYVLDFTASTADIFDNNPPTLDSAYVACGSTELVIEFSENVVCSSVQGSDFTLEGPSGLLTVTGVVGAACQAGANFERVFELQTIPPINQSGNYILSLVDTVVDNCGNVALFDTLSFYVNVDPLIVTASPSTVCAGQATTLTTNLSNIPGYTFEWGTTGITTPTLTVTPTATTNYPVTVTGPGGCQLQGAATVTVQTVPSVLFSIPDQRCVNQSFLILNVGGGGSGSSYLWDFDNPSVATGSGAGPYQVTYSTPGFKEITLQVISNGCASDIVRDTIEILEYPSNAFAAPTEICQGDGGVFTYAGPNDPDYSFVWTFAGASSQVNTNPSTTIGPYVVTWDNAGSQNVCLTVDNQGCTSLPNCQQVEILEAPKVSIDPVDDQCLPGNSFTFTTTGDTADSYQWNFGADALPALSSLPNPGPVTFQNPGPKMVILQVTRDGCVGEPDTITFEVFSPPSADFQIVGSGGCVDSCITFTYLGNILGPNQAFSWDFGTQAIPQASTLPLPPCVTFPNAGTYPITLTVEHLGCVVQSTQNVIVNQGPVVSAGTDTSFCEGEGGVQLDATVLGGNQPYFYQWTCGIAPDCGIGNANVEDPIVNPDFTLAPEEVTYYLQVVDAQGCAGNVDSVVVRVKAKPRMDAGRDTSICSPDAPGAFLLGGVAADNQAPQPILPQWSPADGLNNPNAWSPFARPDTTTIYTLIGVSANGCTSEATTLDTLSTVQITVLPKPVANAGRDTVMCLGDTLRLQGFATGAGPDYQYAWTPANVNEISDSSVAQPFVSPGQTRTFTLSVTSNGCKSDGDQVTVTVHTLPTVDAGSDITVCLFDSVQLNGTIAGDPDAVGYQFQWTPAHLVSNPSAANPIAFPDSTTWFYLTGASEFGCGSNQDSVLFTIEPTPEVALLSQDTTICAGDTISLKASHSFRTAVGSPVIYQWEPELETLAGSRDSIVSVSPAQTTTYTVKTSISSNDCPTTESLVVTVVPKPDASILPDTTVICADDSVRLTGLGGLGNAQFSWLPSGTVSNPDSFDTYAQPGVSTTYLLTVSEGVCQDTASVFIYVHPPVEAEFVSSSLEGCPPLLVDFQEVAQNGISYIWEFGNGDPISNESDPFAIYDLPGTYPISLTVIGAGGCADSVVDQEVFVEEPPIAGFDLTPDGSEILYLPYAEISIMDQSTGATSWYYAFGDGAASQNAHPTYQYQTAGTYEIVQIAMSSLGCRDTASQFLTVEMPDLQIANVLTPNGDGVNDALDIRYRGADSFQLIIYDRWGKKVFESQSPDDRWTGEGDREGVYFYALSIGSQTFRGDVTLLR